LVDDITEKETLYKAYSRFCRKHRLPLVKYDTFCKNMKIKNYPDGRKGKDDREYYWKGIKLVPEYLLEMEQTTFDI
jgi:hypothetical protein